MNTLPFYQVDNKERGLTTAARSPQLRKQLAPAGGTCISSCSLIALQLQAEALETLDSGKMKHMLTECTTVGDILHSAGIVLVNISGWDGESLRSCSVDVVHIGTTDGSMC